MKPLRLPRRKLNILSLFDGMACGLVAAKRAGLRVGNYFASEIDKYAIQIAMKNHPEIVQLGSIENYQTWELPKIDMIIGGSPCQGFSFAGKGLNFDDPRSALFFKFVEILWMLKEKNQDIKFLLENVKMKNNCKDAISELLQVESVFINSALVSAQNRERYYWFNFPGPKLLKDKNIKLKDILEPIDISCNIGIRAKSKCLRVGGIKSPFYSKQKWDSPFIKTDLQLKSKYNQHKASCLTGGAHSGGHHSDMDLLLFKNMECRRYTPIECERLQTLPDNYTEGVSNTQRYKMLGNGWTVDVIKHIFEQMP